MSLLLQFVFKDYKVNMMSWMFLRKKKPAIILYVETWWRISNDETRRSFLVLGAVFCSKVATALNLMICP